MPGGRHIPAKLFSTVCLLSGEEALDHPQHPWSCSVDVRGEGWGWECLCGSAVFTAWILWNSTAILVPSPTPSPIPGAAEQPGQAECLSKGLVAGGDGKPLCSHISAPLACPAAPRGFTWC